MIFSCLRTPELSKLKNAVETLRINATTDGRKKPETRETRSSKRTDISASWISDLRNTICAGLSEDLVNLNQTLRSRNFARTSGMAACEISDGGTANTEKPAICK